MKTFSSMLTGLLTVVVILFLEGFLAGFFEVVTYRTANKTNAVRSQNYNLEGYEKLAFDSSVTGRLAYLEDHYTIRFTRPYWLR